MTDVHPLGETQEGPKYDEQEHLSLWVTGREFPESWNRPKGKEGQSDLFTMKHAVETLLQRVDWRSVDLEPTSEGLLVEGVILRHRSGKEVGRWGMVQPKVAAACGVNVPVFWADFKWRCFGKP